MIQHYCITDYFVEAFSLMLTYKSLTWVLDDDENFLKVKDYRERGFARFPLIDSQSCLIVECL